jgi:ribosomal protein S18 acetylase RimI-like enzyme
MTDLAALRNLLGASTVLWAGPAGLTVAERWWTALSGASSVEYNVALCHGGDAGEDIAAVIESVEGHAVPAIVMLAGEALADAQTLVRAGWICVGATPFMAREICDGQEDAHVRRLSIDELPAARAIVEQAFSLPSNLSCVALPDRATDGLGCSVWGIFGDGAGDESLSACAAFVRVDDAMVAWSVATHPSLRRRGHASRLMRAVLAESAREGARIALVYASAAGAPLYRALGFDVLEQWQLWSRPRWVLARA